MTLPQPTFKKRYLMLIQARLGAHRLPDKVLQPILGQPMILHMLDRLRSSRAPGSIAVAIPHIERDIEQLGRMISRHGNTVIAPEVDECDVLGRFATALYHLSPTPPDETEPMRVYDAVVRLCGDCPMIDPALIDWACMVFEQETSDLVALNNDWPDGLDLEVISTEALIAAHKECDDPVQREHVSQFIWGNKERFRENLIPCPFDLSAHNWSVDTAENLELARGIFGKLYPSQPTFDWRDIYGLLLSDPYLLGLATNRERNAAYMEQTGQSDKTWEEVRYGGQQRQATT